jgi:hypothetical protein
MHPAPVGVVPCRYVNMIEVFELQNDVEAITNTISKHSRRTYSPPHLHPHLCTLSRSDACVPISSIPKRYNSPGTRPSCGPDGPITPLLYYHRGYRVPVAGQFLVGRAGDGIYTHCLSDFTRLTFLHLTKIRIRFLPCPTTLRSRSSTLPRRQVIGATTFSAMDMLSSKMSCQQRKRRDISRECSSG